MSSWTLRSENNMHKQHDWKKNYFLSMKERGFNIPALYKSYLKKTKKGIILIPY